MLPGWLKMTCKWVKTFNYCLIKVLKSVFGYVLKVVLINKKK